MFHRLDLSLLFVGCCLLIVVCWLLVVGCRLLVAVCLTATMVTERSSVQSPWGAAASKERQGGLGCRPSALHGMRAR